MQIISLQSNLFLVAGIASIAYDCAIHKTDYSYIVALTGRMATIAILSVVTLAFTLWWRKLAIAHYVRSFVLTSLVEVGTVAIATYFIKPTSLRSLHFRIIIKRRMGRRIRGSMEVGSVAGRAARGLYIAEQEAEEVVARITKEEKVATSYMENAISTAMAIRKDVTATKKIVTALKDLAAGGKIKDIEKNAARAERILEEIGKVTQNAEKAKYRAEMELQKLQKMTTRIEQSVGITMVEEAKMEVIGQIKTVETITHCVKKNAESVASKQIEVETLRKSAQKILKQATQLALRSCSRRIQ